LFAAPLAKQLFGLLVARTQQHFKDLLILQPPQQAVTLMLVLGVALGALAGWGSGYPSLTVLPIVLAPVVFEAGLLFAKRKRRGALDQQLPDALMTISNCMRSGLTLMQALEVARDNTIAPISKELGIVLSENRLGTTLEASLDKMAQRIHSRYLDTAVSAIAVTRRTGGNVAEGLDSIGNTIREIMRIENQINSMTAQGRMEGIVMGIMPIVALVGFYFFDPEMIEPLFNDSIGHCILVAIVVCDVVAIALIRKIMAIDV